MLRRGSYNYHLLRRNYHTVIFASLVVQFVVDDNLVVSRNFVVISMFEIELTVWL